MTSGKPGVPAVALPGAIALMVAAESEDDAEIVKGMEFDGTPVLATVIDAVPAEAMSAAEIGAVT